MTRSAVLRTHSLNAITAVLFGLAYWRLGPSAELPAVLAFTFGGVLLAAIDWKVQRLPTRIVYYTAAGVAAGLIFASLVRWEWVPLATALAGAAVYSNVFFFIHFMGKHLAGITLIGFGDVRLAAVLGLLLGWYGLPHVVYGALAGTLLAAVVALAMCIRQRKLIMRYSFGPPLIAGTLAVVLFHT